MHRGVRFSGCGSWGSHEAWGYRARRVKELPNDVHKATLEVKVEAMYGAVAANVPDSRRAAHLNKAIKQLEAELDSFDNVLTNSQSSCTGADFSVDCKTDRCRGPVSGDRNQLTSSSSR